MISVIIPLYNKVNAIKRAIDSVLAQTYQDFEIVVVNDGSSDGSEKIVETYGNSKVRLINQLNAGVSAARNRGVQESDGDYILFLDADDYLEKNALNYLFSYCLLNELDVVTAACYIEDSNGQKRIIHQAKTNNIVVNKLKTLYYGGISLRTNSTLLKRKVMLEHPYPTFLSREEDLYNAIEICKDPNIRIGQITEPVATYTKEYQGLSGLVPWERNIHSYLEFDDVPFWQIMINGRNLVAASHNEEFDKKAREKYGLYYYTRYLANIHNLFIKIFQRLFRH